MDPPDIEREILAAERGLYRAQVAGSVERLRPMLGANLVYIHSTGIAESRETYLEGVTDRLYEYGAIASRETRIRMFGQAAMINGIVDMTVSANGAPKILIHLLFCLLWIKEDGLWKLDFRQATRIPDA
jgi:uncharacterized protein DUF4440